MRTRASASSSAARSCSPRWSDRIAVAEGEDGPEPDPVVEGIVPPEVLDHVVVRAGVQRLLGGLHPRRDDELGCRDGFLDRTAKGSQAKHQG
jgi:hypothetical protein